MGMATIGQQLKDAARNTGWTMKKLSIESGLPYAVVHGFMTAERQISIGSASKLAALLGLALTPIRKSTKGGKP